MKHSIQISRRNPERKKRQNKVTVPARVGPHVKLVFSEMFRQRVTYDEIEQGSGVLRSTLKAWRVKNRPGLETLEAVFGFLGFDFVPVPRARVLPPEILAELQPIADRLGTEMPRLIEAVTMIAAGVRERVPTQAEPAPVFIPAEVSIIRQSEGPSPCAA
ncbi:hypothetical protein GOFOIKOB_4879 [Methylobacterium tardum]|nr:hypothetical protein [Methylobacterium tardum]URD35812.1 hypothetical protein M6G65_25700 [Methylobacterium tardum]GJE51815.1 hypothetical protein GOFOIKOB_4879 [Methylobacterium tardum]